MRALALFSALCFSPVALADVIDDSSEPADSADDTSDDKGCATAPVLPGALALGFALAALRRR